MLTEAKFAADTYMILMIEYIGVEQPAGAKGLP